MRTPHVPGIVVMTALLIGMSCSRREPPRQPTEKSTLEPILGAIDAPASGSVAKQTLTAGGWAVAESGVQKVVLYIDRQFVAYASIGGQRPDIAKAYSSFPNAATSGWGAIIDLSPFAEGDHQIVLQVKTKDGNTHDSPPVTFKIQ